MLHFLLFYLKPPTVFNATGAIILPVTHLKNELKDTGFGILWYEWPVTADAYNGGAAEGEINSILCMDPETSCLWLFF